MINHNDIVSFLEWFCSIRNEQNRCQYNLLTTKVYSPGCIRWEACIKQGANTIVLTPPLKSEEHALAFLIAILGGSCSLLTEQENKEFEKTNNWNQYIWGLYQDGKAGGEDRIAIIGIDVLMNYKGIL
jgi:hypothetical protein